MNKQELIKRFDEMQAKYGSPNLCPAYGGGQEHNPDICMVFVNPTARNIATNKSWPGIRCQWLGTKQVWKFLANLGLFDEKLSAKIQGMKASEWTPEFCEQVYKEVARNNLYITNLAKCTQDDAREMPDSMFMQYKDLFFEEMMLVNPRKIILFGNQVSSVVLGKKVSVSEYRKRGEDLLIGAKSFRCFPVYYPVGNGFFNTPKAIEDIKYIRTL